MKLWFNLLCRDIQAQLDFYARLLRWPEAPAVRPMAEVISLVS